MKKYLEIKAYRFRAATGHGSDQFNRKINSEKANIEYRNDWG